VLTGEVLSLTREFQNEIHAFFHEQIAWVENQLIHARLERELQRPHDARESAAGISAMIEGGTLLARALDDPRTLIQAIRASLALVFP